MKKLLSILMLLVAIVTGAKADTVLFTTNFSTADGWDASTSLESGSKVINGTTVSFKNGGTVTAGTTSGSLAFGGSSNIADKTNVSELNYYVAIPVSGVVGGQVTVTCTTSSNFKPYYTYSDGSGSTCVARKQASVNNTFTITGLTSSNVTIYLGTKSKSMTSLTITTPTIADLTESAFYSFFKQSDDAVSAATLITDASLPSYVSINSCTNVDNGSNNTSTITEPYDFSSIDNSRYYRLKPATSSSVVVGALSHVKSIRVYGNGSGSTGNVVTSVAKIQGTGTAMTIGNKAFANSKAVIAEYSTGDLTKLDGYDADTYYLYTLTFSANFSLWGVYVEYYDTAPAGPSLSVDPAEANPFTYVAGEGPSTAQEFTVSLANSEKAVSATLSSTNYEMSKTEDGTYSSDDITDLANDSKVYVRLKAGLAKGTGYDGTLTFANDDVTDDVVVDLSGSVTGVAYAISTTTPSNGSITASATSAPEGDEITLTATPDFRYALSAWNVYKTGEPATTVTVTDNKFTMPAYAVTVDATFAADTKKQVLYVTSDGNVDAGDDLYAALGEDYTVTVAANSASKTVTDFDLVVLHESIGGTSGTSGLAAAAKAGDVPVLNTKSYFYNSGRWGWGTPNAGKEELGCTIGTAYFNIASHPIFAGITPDADGFITVTTAASSDNKVMQPVGSFVSGKEGYTLATSSNADSGNGTAIHELTPAQRGVEAGKYLLISLHNECFNKLTADGIKLFKNAAAYLMSDEAWTPEEIKSLPLNDGGNKFTKGFTTFCSPVNFTVSEGATAYKAAIADSKLTMTALEGIIPANTGVVIAGSKNTNATITATTAAATADVEGNDLKGTTAEALTADLKGTATKFLAFKKSTSTFTPYGGTDFPANKAYLLINTNNTESLEMVFEEATGINNVNAAETEAQAAPVKVIKNGKLYIGNYNVAGQQVK